MLTITDISHWEGQVDFVKMKAAGAVGVIFKASQANYTDTLFASSWIKAKDAGLLRGAFHYLDWTMPAQEQAEYFCDLIESDPGDFPPCIDYEQSNPPADKVSRLQDAMSEVFDRFGRAMIYTGPAYWEEHGSTDVAWSKYPLWLAHWIDFEHIETPAPWSKWSIWQYTAKAPGYLYGCQGDVDLNYFNGTLDELRAFCNLPVTYTPNKYVVSISAANVRSSGVNAGLDNFIGQVKKGEVLDVDQMPATDYWHFRPLVTPTANFPAGGWIYKAYLTKYIPPVLTIEQRLAAVELKLQQHGW